MKIMLVLKFFFFFLLPIHVIPFQLLLQTGNKHKNNEQQSATELTARFLMLHFLCFTDIYLSNLQELLPTTIYTFFLQKKSEFGLFSQNSGKGKK